MADEAKDKAKTKVVDMKEREAVSVAICYLNEKGQKVTETIPIPHEGLVVRTKGKVIKIYNDA